MISTLVGLDGLNAMYPFTRRGVGSSSKIDDIELEVNKAKLAQEYGADALMDLSTGSDLKLFRKTIISVLLFMMLSICLWQRKARKIWSLL